MDMLERYKGAKLMSEMDHSKPLPSGVYIVRATDRPYHEKQLAPILKFVPKDKR